MHRVFEWVAYGYSLKAAQRHGGRTQNLRNRSRL